MAEFSLQFLGTGTSVGLPMIGCSCAVCTSADPHDQRMRSAAYVRLGDKGLLLDAGPDLRMQCLRWKVPRVDAVFITHLHADHIFGFDDIRRFNTIQQNQLITCYGGPKTLEGMQRIFPYIGSRPNPMGLYRPLIDFVPQTGPFEALGAMLTPLPVIHGNSETFGIRIDFAGKSMAYVPDVHEIPSPTLALMRNLDLLVLNLLRVREHPTHLTLEQSLAYAAQINATETRFIHFSHDLSHAQLLTHMPPHCAPAFDGLRIPLAE